jgi:penicillin G amidase
VLFHYKPADVYRKLFQQNPATGELLAQSLLEVVNKLTREHGPMGESWQWWRFNGSTIRHMLDIPAFNQARLQVGGSSESPNAIANNHGPSWRMVAQLSQPVKAWGILPGGQTGNPASAGFNASIRDWAAGRYYELELFDSFEQATVIHLKTFTLKPANNK